MISENIVAASTAATHHSNDSVACSETPPRTNTNAIININADETVGTMSVNDVETEIQVQREVDEFGNLTGGFVPASQEDADNLSTALDMDISTDTPLGTSEQVTTDNSTNLDQSGIADTGNQSVPAVSNETITGSNLAGYTGTATRDDNGEDVFVQFDQHGNVIDVSYEPVFDEPTVGIQPLDVYPASEPITPVQPPGTNTAPPTQTDAATTTTDSMTQSDIGPTTLPGTPIGQPAGATAFPGTPLDEPVGATVMPGTPIDPPPEVAEIPGSTTLVFPIAEPISSSTSGDHNAEDHHDEIPGPGANVYQSDNVNQSDGNAVEPGTLSGNLTVIPPNARAEQIRGLSRENEAASILVENGYDVEQNPDVPGGKDPDYMISGPDGNGVIGEGVVADALSPITSNTFNIFINIDEKITSGQAEAVVVNLADSEATAQELIEELAINPVDGPVIIIDQQHNIYIVE